MLLTFIDSRFRGNDEGRLDQSVLSGRSSGHRYQSRLAGRKGVSGMRRSGATGGTSPGRAEYLPYSACLTRSEELDIAKSELRGLVRRWRGPPDEGHDGPRDQVPVGVDRDWKGRLNVEHVPRGGLRATVEVGIVLKGALSKVGDRVLRQLCQLLGRQLGVGRWAGRTDGGHQQTHCELAGHRDASQLAVSSAVMPKAPRSVSGGR